MRPPGGGVFVALVQQWSRFEVSCIEVLRALRSDEEKRMLQWHLFQLKGPHECNLRFRGRVRPHYVLTNFFV